MNELRRKSIVTQLLIVVIMILVIIYLRPALNEHSWPAWPKFKILRFESLSHIDAHLKSGPNLLGNFHGRSKLKVRSDSMSSININSSISQHIPINVSSSNEAVGLLNSSQSPSGKWTSYNFSITLSTPKSGTTALEWIVQSLFNNVRLECLHSYAVARKEKVPIITNTVRDRNRIYGIKWEGKRTQIRFNVHPLRKHTYHGIGPLSSSSWAQLDLMKEATILADSKVKAWESSRLTSKLASLKAFLKANSKSKHKEKTYFTLFRNPVSVVVSRIHYYNPDISKKKLNQLIEHGRHLPCAVIAAKMALEYRLITEVFQPAGYNVHILFFEDMRLEPEHFVANLAQLLGLRINNNIIQHTLSETSPEHMRKVQNSLNQNYNTTAHGNFAGLSNNERNQMKVRNANITGYLEEMTSSVLSECFKALRFHIPPSLKQRYG